MPTVYPIQWQPPVITGVYRNLQRRDIETWEKWLAAHAAEWEAVAYDVAVGGIAPADPASPPAQLLGWKYTTALKIDVLLMLDGRVTVVEVKPAATVSAIGAAVAYPLVLAREEPALDIAGGGIICQHLPPDIRWVAEALEIRTWEV